MASWHAVEESEALLGPRQKESGGELVMLAVGALRVAVHSKGFACRAWWPPALAYIKAQIMVWQ